MHARRYSKRLPISWTSHGKFGRTFPVQCSTGITDRNYWSSVLTAEWQEHGVVVLVT